MKRILAVGCSHGNLANKDALAAVLLFKEQFKPDISIHLGDAIDTACFRSGGHSSDEATPIEPDLNAGIRFINEFRPDVFCMGNHEHRLVKLTHHHSQIIAEAADSVLNQFLAPLKQLQSIVIPYTIHKHGWYKLANYHFGHGHFYGEQFLRDTAECVGNTVCAHAHRPGVQNGRTLQPSTAYCVGTLADIPNMDYANGRKSTLAWGFGMVWGDVSNNECHLNLTQWPREETEFALPL